MLIYARTELESAITHTPESAEVFGGPCRPLALLFVQPKRFLDFLCAGSWCWCQVMRRRSSLSTFLSFVLNAWVFSFAFLLYLFVFLLSLRGAKLGKLVDVRWKSVSLIYLRFTDQLPTSPIPHGEPSRCLALIDIHMTHRLHTNTLSTLLIGRSRRLTNCVSFILHILKMWAWATRKTTGRPNIAKACLLQEY